MASAVEQFGGRIRVRSCGILIQNGSILLVNQKGLNGEKHWWSPPGGGVEFGESIADALKREFLEETGLEVKIGKLIDTSEYINAPYHAVEFFHEVHQVNGNVVTGKDPELTEQIILEVKFVPFEELAQLPAAQKHPIISKVISSQQI